MTKKYLPSKLDWRSFLSSPWLKVVVALAVIGALLSFNRIEMSTFQLLRESWGWLVLAFVAMLPPYVIVSFRFWIVLNNQGIECELPSAVRWTMIGSFFDLMMPSNSGGDIVKAGYLLQEVPGGGRTKAMMAIALDRVLGLIGLFLLAAISCLIGWEVIVNLPGITGIVSILAVLCVLPLAFFRILGSRRIYGSKGLKRLLGHLPMGTLIFSIIGCFNRLREKPLQLVIVLGLSIINHLFWCTALFCVSMAFGQQVGISQGFVVFPMAIFSNIFGFAGGFGVGTAAFDVIFVALLNIQIGAVIGLVFQMLSAISRLLGLPYYLGAGSRKKAI